LLDVLYLLDLLYLLELQLLLLLQRAILAVLAHMLHTAGAALAHVLQLRHALRFRPLFYENPAMQTSGPHHTGVVLHPGKGHGVRIAVGRIHGGSCPPSRRIAEHQCCLQIM